MASGKKTGRKSQASNDFVEPLAPESVSATDVPSGRAYNDGRADVTFSLPANSLPATSYTVTSTPGSYTGTGSSSPISVTGLQSDTAYTFTVIATNSIEILQHPQHLIALLQQLFQIHHPHLLQLLKVQQQQMMFLGQPLQLVAQQLLVMIGNQMIANLETQHQLLFLYHKKQELLSPIV